MKYIANNYTSESGSGALQSDFEIFYRQLVSLLKVKNATDHLFERDLFARSWYRNLFADTDFIISQMIVRSRETEIVESSFNWAGLFNKYYRSGTDYYLDLKATKGKYYNLVVYEATDNGFSLYDMDEIDYGVFQLLQEPLSIKGLLIEMQTYFEDDVLKNHYEVFENLILMSIKQLVVKKAIKPFEN